jgi:hypothetical protein
MVDIKKKKWDDRDFSQIPIREFDIYDTYSGVSPMVAPPNSNTKTPNTLTVQINIYLSFTI